MCYFFGQSAQKHLLLCPQQKIGRFSTAMKMAFLENGKYVALGIRLIYDSDIHKSV